MHTLEVAFGEWFFRSYNEAKRDCISRLARYQTGDYLRGEDRKFFLALFRARYPYFEETFYGDDLDPSLADDPSLQLVDWKKYTRPSVAARGLRVIREDGSWRPISWRCCIDKANHRTWVNAACRVLVAPQRRAFLADWTKRIGNASCISGKTDEHLIVDYPIEAAFFFLVRSWIEQENLSFSDIVLSESRLDFADAGLSESWRAFHRQHAQMRVITESERHNIEA